MLFLRRGVQPQHNRIADLRGPQQLVNSKHDDSHRARASEVHNEIWKDVV